ncbi:fimbrial protein [Pseudomonas fluorescens]|uniref:fimbrial protein n=1 Tax=Pseudomonas fluorescens TaxID=294 RepID=UPI000937DEDD|nr:fimbrial protein [Pseudomonas fluorescens]
MKYSIKLIPVLLTFGVSITAQAACERYPNSYHTLTMDSTVIVPDSLPVGGLITRKAFSGTAPGFSYRCPTYTQRTITGRYTTWFPGTQIYRTEAAGIGARLYLREPNGRVNAYSMRSATVLTNPGTYTSFTNAEIEFYKIGQVSGGIINAGDFYTDKMGHGSDRFMLRLGHSIRFVRPAATCDLATGDVNRTIPLDPINASALQNATFLGQRNFELTANCSNAANVTFRFTGTPSPGHTTLFANTGTARGAGLWLFSRIGGANQTIGADGSTNTRTVAVSGNRAVLPLGAGYHKNGTVSAGTFASTATVNITYN